MTAPHTPKPKFAIIVVGILIGGVLGLLIYGITLTPPFWKSICIGALTGACVSPVSPLIFAMWRKLSTSDWKVEEIEIQGVKFTNDASQRRAAWKIFFNMATRVALRRQPKDVGDNGAILKSLYAIFQDTRATIITLDSTLQEQSETVETYALKMLNETIAPFLQTWHPRWDDWSDREDPPTINDPKWELHQAFRDELFQLQKQLRNYAESLATIAGVKKPERFLPQKK